MKDPTQCVALFHSVIPIADLRSTSTDQIDLKLFHQVLLVQLKAVDRKVNGNRELMSTCMLLLLVVQQYI